jgi:hypothetical protein
MIVNSYHKKKMVYKDHRCRIIHRIGTVNMACQCFKDCTCNEDYHKQYGVKELENYLIIPKGWYRIDKYKHQVWDTLEQAKDAIDKYLYNRKS